MRWKLVLGLLAAGLLVLLVQSWGSRPTAASPPSCGECQARCVNDCTKQGSYCQFAGPVCFDGDCGPGGCSYICGNGRTGSFSCECTTCTQPPPGGSPIFRKQETTTLPACAEPTASGL
jgi:hypothetical protein